MYQLAGQVVWPVNKLKKYKHSFFYYNEAIAARFFFLDLVDTAGAIVV